MACKGSCSQTALRRPMTQQNPAAMAMRWHRMSVACLILFVACRTAAALPPVNALWNDDDGFGIWLYGRAGSCSEFQYKLPPYVIVGNGTDRSEIKEGQSDISQMSICIRATRPDVAFCTSGNITFRYEPSRSEYLGSYDIKLSDGTTWSGPLRAQHCSRPSGAR